MWVLYCLNYAYNILISVIYAFVNIHIYFCSIYAYFFFVDFALSFICFGIVMQICGGRWPTATIFKQTKFKPSLDMKFADRNNYAR